MPTPPLTDSRVKAAKYQPGKRETRIADGGGMYLAVTPSGAKLWRMAYRWPRTREGAQQTASFGSYPEVTLADARAARAALQALLDAGIDPRAHKRAMDGLTAAPAAPATPAEPPPRLLTLREANERYWSGRGDLSAAYVKKSRTAIEVHLAKLLDLPMGMIERDMLLRELDVMNAAGKFVYVRKVKMWVGSVFEWALQRPSQTGVKYNPAASINSKHAFGRRAVTHLPALKLPKVPELMQRLSFESQSLQSVIACRVMALTWVRTKELRLMRVSELEEDITLWRIPAETMKMGGEHLVPLSKQARALIKQAIAQNRGSEYVFPNPRRIDRPMSENAVLYLLHRMGFKGDMSGHGWRTVASTWANENGWDATAVERQLAHAPRGAGEKVRAIYNQAEYLPLRKKMMQAWADWLEQVDAARPKRRNAPALAAR